MGGWDSRNGVRDTKYLLPFKALWRSVEEDWSLFKMADWIEGLHSSEKEERASKER